MYEEDFMWLAFFGFLGALFVGLVVAFSNIPEDPTSWSYDKGKEMQLALNLSEEECRHKVGTLDPEDFTLNEWVQGCLDSKRGVAK